MRFLLVPRLGLGTSYINFGYTPYDIEETAVPIGVNLR